MKALNCINCGATDMIRKDGYMECQYCNSKFSIEATDFPQQSMGMSLNEDVDNLLKKCKKDTKNARKYANLILDIDPTNVEALQYI